MASIVYTISRTRINAIAGCWYQEMKEQRRTCLLSTERCVALICGSMCDKRNAIRERIFQAIHTVAPTRATITQ